MEESKTRATRRKKLPHNARSSAVRTRALFEARVRWRTARTGLDRRSLPVRVMRIELGQARSPSSGRHDDRVYDARLRREEAQGGHMKDTASPGLSRREFLAGASALGGVAIVSAAAAAQITTLAPFE